jgi:hypothetical protein
MTIKPAMKDAFFAPARLCLFALGVLLFVLPTTAFAQSNGNGSIYSRFGLGELKTLASPQAQALGGGGVGLRSLNYTSLSNPALWSDQVLTRFVLGGNYHETNARDARGTQSELVAGTLNAVQFSFPIYTRKLGFSVGYHPYSLMNYRVVRRPETPFQFGPAPTDTTAYTVDYEGRGGIQQISGGLGWRISNALSVGASVDALFGILEEARETTLGPGFAPINFTDATRLSGFTGTFGALLTVADLFADDDALSLGGSLMLPASLDGRRVRTLGESLSRDTIGTVVDGSVDLPWRAQGGLTYKPNNSFTITADGLYAPWSTAESTFDGASEGPSQFPIGGSAFLTDRWRVSGGVEYLPAGNDPSASYFGRAAYRLGGYYEQTYAAPVAGESIDVRAATAGLSLPTRLSGTRLDLDVEVGVRGTTSRNLVRDIFYGVSVNVNIGERWFQERKLR